MTVISGTVDSRKPWTSTMRIGDSPRARIAVAMSERRISTSELRRTLRQDGDELDRQHERQHQERQPEVRRRLED